MAAAVQLFQRALWADSTYALSHLALGISLMLRKEFSRAIAHFQQGLRHDPDNAKLRRNLALAQEIAAGGD